MRPLERRLRRLERSLAPGPRALMHAVVVADGEGLAERGAAVLAAAGVAPGPDDLVVLMRRFADADRPGRLVSSRPMTGRARPRPRP